MGVCNVIACFEVGIGGMAWQGAEEEETLHLEDFIVCTNIQILKFRCERFFFQHVAYFFVSTHALSSW